MKNFLFSAAVDILVILLSYGFFRTIIRGPIKHKIYEKLMSSLSKFIIYVFILSVSITGITAFIMYRSRYLAYLNIVSAALMSMLVGFIVSTVPTRGVGDKPEITNKMH
ncbi:MAG: hypothetical protein ACERKV_00015 [Clostridiaceae bacterium]